MRMCIAKYYGIVKQWEIRIVRNNEDVFSFRICLGNTRFYVDILKKG